MNAKLTKSAGALELCTGRLTISVFSLEGLFLILLVSVKSTLSSMTPSCVKFPAASCISFLVIVLNTYHLSVSTASISSCLTCRVPDFPFGPLGVGIGSGAGLGPTSVDAGSGSASDSRGGGRILGRGRVLVAERG
jgi:predicted membrane metal-binding protein